MMNVASWENEDYWSHTKTLKGRNSLITTTFSSVLDSGAGKRICRTVKARIKIYLLEQKNLSLGSLVSLVFNETIPIIDSQIPEKDCCNHQCKILVCSL